jgi:hypothetical protein
MHPLRVKYLAVETAISMAINGLLSAGFAWLIFHGHDYVPINGPGGLVRDAGPQTFMIALMGTLVPSLITRQRMRAGHLDAWLQRHSGARQRRGSTIFLRALVMAIVGVALGLAINQTILPLLFPAALAYERVLLFKTVYGLLVALVVTPFAVSWVLKESLPG